MSSPKVNLIILWSCFHDYLFEINLSYLKIVLLQTQTKSINYTWFTYKL